MADITYTNTNGIPLQEPLGFNVGYKEQTPELQRAASAGQFVGGLLDRFKAEYVTLRTALEQNHGWGEGWRVVDVYKQDVPGGTTVDSVTMTLQLNDLNIKATVYGSFAPKANSPASVMTLSGSSISWEITGNDVPGIPPEGSENAVRFSAVLAGADKWSMDFVQDDPNKIYFNDNFTATQNPASTVSGAVLLGAFMLPMATPTAPTATLNGDSFQKIVREYVNSDDANEILVFNATAASPFRVGDFRAGGLSQYPYSDPLSVGGKYYSLTEVLDQWSENYQNAEKDPLDSIASVLVSTAPTLTVNGVNIDIGKFAFNPTSGTEAQIESFAKHVVNELNTLKLTNGTIKGLLSDGRLAVETNSLLQITNSPQTDGNNPIPVVVYKKIPSGPDNPVFSFDTRDSARLSGTLDGITSITGLDSGKTTIREVFSVQGGSISDVPSVGEIKSLTFTGIASTALQQNAGLVSISMQSASEKSPIVVTLNLSKAGNGTVVIAGTSIEASAQNLAVAFVEKFNAQSKEWAEAHDKPYIPLIAYAGPQAGEIRLAFNSAFGDVRGSLASDPTGQNSYTDDPVNGMVLRNTDWSVASTAGQLGWSVKSETVRHFSGKPSDITFTDSAKLGFTGVTRTSGAFSLDVTKMDAVLPATSSEIKVTGTSQFVPLNSLPVDSGLGQAFRGDDKLTITDSIGAVVAAGNGNDTVIGGDGDDVIEGGGGNDNLSGAGGDDLFIINKGYVLVDGRYSPSYLYTDPDSRSGNTITHYNNVSLPGGTSSLKLDMLQSTTINGGQGLDTLVLEEGVPQRLQLLLPSAYQVVPEAHTLKFNAAAAKDGAVVVTLTHLFPAPIRININIGDTAAVMAANVVAAFNADPWFKNGYGGDRVAFVDPADPTGSTVKFQFVHADGNVTETPSVLVIGSAVSAPTVTGDVAPTFNVPGVPFNSSPYTGFIGNVPAQTALGKIFAEAAGPIGSSVYQGVSLPSDGQLGFKFASTWKDIRSDQLGSDDYLANEYYRVSDVEFIQAKSFGYSFDTASITATRTGAATITVRLAAIDTPIDVVVGATDTKSDIATKILTEIQRSSEFVSKGWKAYISPEDLATVKIIFSSEVVTSPPNNARVLVSSNAATLPVAVTLQSETVDREGTELIDIRPLYLATSGNDTLYAFSRAGLNSLEQVIDRSSNTGYWLADDPLSLFEYNFVGPASDSYYFLAGGAGNDRLIGSVFSDDSSGNRGRDVLDGGAGNDTMIGGGGNDVYYVDSAADVVVESLVDDKFIFDDLTGEYNGYDTVIVRNSFVLQAGNSVERMLVHNLFLQNYAGDNPSLANPNTQYQLTPTTTAVNITGGNFTIELAGHDGANDITAGSMAGMLTGQMSYYGGALLLGMGGNDKLTGGDGSDRLFGGIGNDTLLGGAGNDFFYMGFGSDRLGLDLDGNETPSLWTSPNKELNAYSLLREWGLDAENATQVLTGGNDTVTGGVGIDTVVIGSGPNADPVTDQRFDSTTQNDYFGKINFERFFEGTVEKIRISTPFAESMVVDSSVELVRFSNGDLFFLPWTSVIIDGKTVQLRDEKARDAYIKSVLDSVEPGSIASDGEGVLPAFIYAPASAGADFVDLRLQNARDAVYDSQLTGTYYPSVSWNGLAGDDIIYAGSQYHRILGGAGNDWIYSSGFNADIMFPIGTTMYRQELYGEADNDTFTANLGEFTSADAGVTSSTLLLDGGAGNDTYRLSLLGQPLGDNFKVEINDIVGNNTLVIALNDDSSLLPYYDPASGTFRLLYADRRSANGGDLKYQEILSVSQNAAQKTFQNVIISDEDKFFTPQYSLNLVLSGAIGTAGNDLIVPTSGTKQIYDGAAGDDYILVGGEPGSIVIGGAGFNQIGVVDRQFYPGYDLNHTLSYAWNAAGAFTDINLEYGYSYAYTAAGVRIASDRISEKEAFPNVIGGASNDTITGNRYANRLEGAAGNDILISGRNVADTPLAEYDGRELTKGDILLGGAGNDILVESASYDEPGSLLDGGDGNDTYILGEGSTQGERILTTRIVDRAVAGSDDTIKFRGDMDPGPIRYTQTGSTIKVEIPLSDEGDGLFAGKLVTLDFQTGPGVDSNYRVLSVQRDSQGRALSFDVAASTTVTVPVSGIVMGSDVLSPRLGIYWVNADTAAIVDYRALDSGLVGSLSDGRPLITDLGNGYLSSLAPVVAQVDKLALDNIEIGGDETTTGMRYKVSFNQGVLSTTEVVMSSTNTSSTLFGGLGSDFIFDTVQDDLLIGGEGNDSLYSFAGFDILLGGAGDDKLNFYSNGQIISGGSGADIFEVVGLKFNAVDNEYYSGEMTLITDYRQTQKDVFTFQEDWLGEITSYGSTYAEVKSYSEPFAGTEAFYLNVGAGSQADRYYLFDLKVSEDWWVARNDIQTVKKSLDEQLKILGMENNANIGTSGDDDLNDAAFSGKLYGLDGDDILISGQFGTQIFGGLGDDELIITTNAGQILVGGEGNDIFILAVKDSFVDLAKIIDFTAGQDQIMLDYGGPAGQVKFQELSDEGTYQFWLDTAGDDPVTSENTFGLFEAVDISHDSAMALAQTLGAQWGQYTGT